MGGGAHGADEADEARAALWAGARALAGRWHFTLGAVGLACLAAMARAAAWQGAVRLGERALARGLPGPAARAAGLVASGFSLAGLLVMLGTTLAVVGYNAPSRVGLRHALALALVRLPAFVTTTVLELAIAIFPLYGALLAISALPPPPTAARAALAGALLFGPPLALALLTLTVGRIARTLVARGLQPAAAWVHACDLALRRLPTLAALGGRLLVATLPLTLLAVGLLAVEADAGPPASALAAAVRAGSLTLASLWLYAALAHLVGRDARLVTG